MAFVVKDELAKVKKSNSKSAFVLIKEVEANGKRSVDMREHFSRADGSVQHTAKGFTLSVEDFENFVIEVRNAWDKLQG